MRTLTSLACGWLLASALFAPATALSTQFAVAQPAAGDPDALALIERVEKAYSSLKSYRDSGDLHATMVFPGPQGASAPQVTEAKFETAFIAPTKFCFRMPLYHDPMVGGVAGLVSLDGDTARSWRSGRAVSEGIPFKDAIASGFGMSDGAIGVVVPLLLPAQSAPIIGPFATLVGAKLLEDAEIDGHQCHRLTGMWNSVQQRTYWIDAKSNLIRRMESVMSLLANQTTTVNFTPEANGEVPESAFTFDTNAMLAALPKAAPPGAASVPHRPRHGPWRSDGPVEDPGDPAAVALLVKMLETYAAASTYTDSGRSVSHANFPAPHQSTSLFTVASRKDGAFLFRFVSPDIFSWPIGGFVWSDGKTTRSYSKAWGVHPRPSIAAGLDSSIFESGGTSSLIEALVAPPGGAEAFVHHNLPHASLLEEQSLGAVRCRRVRAQQSEMSTVVLWIDDANLLRRFDHTVTMGPVTTATTTLLNPVINAIVPEQALAFDVPAMQEAIQKRQLPGSPAP